MTQDSYAANQSKTEPMPPTDGHADPDAAPEPATTADPAGAPSVGESPSFGSAAVGVTPDADATRAAPAGSGDAQSVRVPSETAAPGTSEELPVVQGVHVPD